MMKIIHLLPALEQGGVETVVCDLVRELGSHAGMWKCENAGNGENGGTGNWESVVVSKGGRLVKKVEAAGGRHIALDLKSKNPLTYFSRVWKLRRILREEKPDLVCVHSRVPAWLYVGVRRLDSVIRRFGGSAISPPWITYAHGANSVSRYSAVMTRGDRVIVPSKFLADYLKESYRLGDERIRIVPNAVDATRFDPNGLDGELVAAKRREWGIEPGDNVMMAIGRITPVKGLETLIASLRHGEKLVIVGSADRRHLRYLATLKALAAGKPVVFAGAQERIPECLAIADEVVSGNTTKPETFGLSVVEAFAMNKPVRLMRRFGGAAEVLDAVGRMQAPSLRAAVIALYSPERQLERTLAVYRELIGQQGGGET